MERIQTTKKYTVDKTAKTETDFERAVKATANLIERPYFVTFRLVEDWQLHKILRRLNEAKNCENPQRYWWGKRKRDIAEQDQRSQA